MEWGRVRLRFLASLGMTETKFKIMIHNNLSKRSLLALLGWLMLIASSCSKKFITQTPYDGVLTDEAITNVVTLQAALTGAYNRLNGIYGSNEVNNPAGLFGRDLPIIGDLQADNTYITISNTNRYLTEYQYNIINTNAEYAEMFNAAYAVILSANQVIDADITGDGVTQIKAQAYGLRGLMYFVLVNLYARPSYTADSSAMGVPLVLHYDPYVLPSRSSVGTVYNQIVSDLQEAFQDCPDYANSVTLSKYSAEALLARTYLYMGKNAEAKAAAVDVINNSGFQLVSPANYRAFWSNPAVQTNQTEVMFEVNEDVNQNNGFEDFAGMYENGYDDIYASSQLVNLYSPTDVRLSVIQAGTNAAGYPGYIVTKFPNASNSDRDNIKVIRLAEVYLIAAEASLPDNEADAKMYLNDLMAQRDPSLTYTSTGAQLLDDIVTERRKELAFEGLRLWDMNRLQRDIVRGTDQGALPISAQAVPTAPTIPYSNYERIGPIPENEILANPNIANEQNPGYGQ